MSAVRLKIEQLTPTELAAQLVHNGHAAACDAVTANNINGKAFLDMSSSVKNNLRRWMPLTDLQAFWSFTLKVQCNPNNFTFEAKPNQVQKNSERSAIRQLRSIYEEANPRSCKSDHPNPRFKNPELLPITNGEGLGRLRSAGVGDFLLRTSRIFACELMLKVDAEDVLNIPIRRQNGCFRLPAMYTRETVQFADLGEFVKHYRKHGLKLIWLADCVRLKTMLS